MSTLSDGGSLLFQELVDRVIDHLWDDKPSLGACTLVCSSWLPEARYHLFREIILRFSNSCTEKLCLFPQSVQDEIWILYSRTRELELSLHDFTVKEIAILVSKMPMLRWLRLDIQVLRHEQGSIMPVCPSVREITLRGVSLYESLLLMGLYLAFPNTRILKISYPHNDMPPQTLPTELALEYLEVEYGGIPLALLKDLPRTACKNTLRGLGLFAHTQYPPVLQNFPLEMKRNIRHLRLVLHGGLGLEEHNSNVTITCKCQKLHCTRLISSYSVILAILSTFPGLQDVSLTFSFTALTLSRPLEDQLPSLAALPKGLQFLTIECDLRHSQGFPHGFPLIWKKLDSVVLQCPELKLVRCLEYHARSYSDFSWPFSEESQQGIRELLPTLNASGLLRF
ncbi:hypothetical protein QCA50_005710 [Cerrena zonata]|uniref:Uncharacterized protein n=1 Tax=Cerrena zonata TaxID=2478898 RepID=A0AAW0GCG7_9APHY